MSPREIYSMLNLVYNSICFLVTKNKICLSLQVKNGGFHTQKKKIKITSNHIVQDNCSTVAVISFQSFPSVCVYLNNKIVITVHMLSVLRCTLLLT